MNVGRVRIALLGLVGLAAVGAMIDDESATALELPDATYESLGVYPELSGPGTGTASFSSTGANGQPASGEATVVLGGPVPSIGVTVNASNAIVGAEGEIIYYFEITGGPATPTPVLVDVSAFASTTAGGDGGAGITFALGVGLQTAGDTIATWGASNCGTGYNEPPGACDGIPTGITVDTTEELTTNTLYFVLLAAGGGVSEDLGPCYCENYAGTGGMDAFVDPSFQIDPSNSDASLYSIVFSAGIENPVGPPVPPPTGVPEPASPLLLAAGLGGVGALRWRKRA